MNRRLSNAWWIVGLIGLASPLSAADQKEIVAKGKGATAFVEVKQNGRESSGSSFCVDKSGLFITNAHVVEGVPLNSEGRVKLVINIGTKAQKVMDAKVYRADPEADLALLKIATLPGLVPLSLGKDEDLFETQDVTTYGFPFGKLNSVALGKYPEMSITPARITSLKRADERIRLVQFDGQINPGNSGGPLIDTDGKVVGVATLTVRGAGLNYAVPVGELAEFLEAPGLDFEPPLIPFGNRSAPLTWTIRVLPSKPGEKPPANLDVKLLVNLAVEEGEEPEAVAIKSIGNGAFQASFVPAPALAERKIRVDAVVDGQEHHLWIRDREISVAGRKLRISDLRQVVRRGDPRAVTQDGEAINGRTTGFPKVKSRIGATTTTVDLDQAGTLALKASDGVTPVRFVEATVEASVAGKVFTSIVRRVDFSGDFPGLTKPSASRNPPPSVVPPPVAPPPGPSSLGLPTRPPTPSKIVNQDVGDLPTGGNLDATDTPLGAGLSIRPPSVPMGDVAAESKPPRRLAGHTNGIWGVAISPDGRQALSGSHDVSVRLWDLTAGKEARRLLGHSDHVKGVAFLPDGVRGLSVADDDTARLWNLRTGAEIRSFRGHTADLSSIAVSADGTRAFTGAGDKTARLWNVETGGELRKFVGHADVVESVALLPDGRRGLSSGADGTVRLWELATGRELARFEPKAGPVHSLAVSPDGKLVLAGCEDGTVRAWDPNSNKEVGRLDKHLDAVRSVAITPDGRRAVSAGGAKDHSVRIWDLARFEEIPELRRADLACSSVKVSADGRLVVAGSAGEVLAWDLPADSSPSAGAARPGPLERVLPGKIGAIAVGGGGRYFLMTMKGDRSLVVFDVNAADVVKTIPLDFENVLIAAGADKFVIAFPEQKQIQRWDFRTMERDVDAPSSLPIDGRLKHLALGSDSAGPILLAWGLENDPMEGHNNRFGFVALDSLKLLKVGTIRMGGSSWFGSQSKSGGSFRLPKRFQEFQVRASAGGGLFTSWETKNFPTAFQTLRLQGREATSITQDDENGYLSPGPDGRTVYTLRNGRRDFDGYPIGEVESAPGQPREICMPTYDPAYFLSFAMPPKRGAGGSNEPVPPPLSASIRTTGDGTKLFTFAGIDQVFPPIWGTSLDRSGTNVEKRFHVLPSAKLLITIPASDDRLVLRRLDIDEAIAKLEGNYLIVVSSPTIRAKLGRPLEHKILAKSKAGKVTYKVTDGPAGLKVDPEGKLTFAVPKTLDNGEVKAVIAVADGSGQERSHKLTIRAN